MRLRERIAGRDRDRCRDVASLPALRSKAVATGVDEDSIEPGLEARRVTEGRPLAPGLLERVVGSILRVGRVAEDRPRQAVGGVEMMVRKAHERRPAFAWLGHGWPAFCHLDDLGRSVHDDMTIQRSETFTRGGIAPSWRTKPTG